MSSSETQNSSDYDNACVVCFRDVNIYSIGVCDHPVCFECSTRMRVLCRQNECPICRQDLPKVVFTRKIELFNVLKAKYEGVQFQDRNFGIYFASPSIQAAYYELLSHDCPKCSTDRRRFSFKNFQKLKDHMRKDHELYYCDLCVENLKIFTFERRCYNRTELAQHRRKGDTDNTSHRGHPLCEFCDQRYVDSDELFRHLRRDHLYCHFCDAEGRHLYYNSYSDLRNHFKEEHYLCEEGECKNQPFVFAFNSEIDLKAHIAFVHGKNWSKSANKQARTLELEFTLAPRNRLDQNNSRSSRKPHDKRNDRDDQEGAVGYEPSLDIEGTLENQKTAKPLANPLNPADFPSLGNDTPQITRPSSSVTFTSKIGPKTFNEENFPALSSSSKGNGVTITGKLNTFHTKDFSNVAGFSKAPDVTITRTIKSQQGLQKNDENFPALGDSTCGSTIRLSLNGNLQNHKGPNVSIHLNHKSNGTITTGTVQVRPQTAEAFPALSSEPVPEARWVIQKSKKQEIKNSTKKVAPAPALPPNSLHDFPTLSQTTKNDKTKKSSSVLVNLNTYNSLTKSLKENTSNNQETNKTNNNNSNSTKQKQEKLKDANNKLVKTKVNDSKSEVNESKNKSKKKKSKNTESVPNSNVPTTSANECSQTTSGMIKKISELKIEALEVTDESNQNVMGFGESKPPPGFNIKPPPGFNNFNVITKQSSRANINLKTPTSPNDLTFTTSSGQCYSILPQYHEPPNFDVRNDNLIKNFMEILQSKDLIAEFKSYSDLFRKGIYPPIKFFEHCQSVLGNEFNKIFPELLVLLPDIEKQQELYKIFISNCSNTSLIMCPTCKQIVLNDDLQSHLANHSYENHFPILNHSNVNNSNAVRKKNVNM